MEDYEKLLDDAYKNVLAFRKNPLLSLENAQKQGD